MQRTKAIAEKLQFRGVRSCGFTEWKQYEDGDIDLGDGYHVQVGTDYLCLTKNSYDHDGNIQAIRFVLENTTVEAIVRYFWEKE